VWVWNLTENGGERIIRAGVSGGGGGGVLRKKGFGHRWSLSLAL
jgi:hypothetical protein